MADLLNNGVYSAGTVSHNRCHFPRRLEACENLSAKGHPCPSVHRHKQSNCNDLDGSQDSVCPHRVSQCQGLQRHTPNVSNQLLQPHSVWINPHPSFHSKRKRYTQMDFCTRLAKNLISRFNSWKKRAAVIYSFLCLCILWYSHWFINIHTDLLMMISTYSLCITYIIRFIKFPIYCRNYYI